MCFPHATEAKRMSYIIETFHEKKKRYKKRVRYLEKNAPESSDAIVFNRKAITEIIGRQVFEALSKDESHEVQLWLDYGCQFYIGEDCVGRLGNNGILSTACFNHRIPESVYCSIHDPVTRLARNDKRAKNTHSRKGKGSPLKKQRTDNTRES